MRFTLGFGSALGRRRWLRGFAGGLLALVLLVAAAPYLLSWTPLANLALGGATWRLRGRATVGAASLDWFSPPALSDLEVWPREGPPVVRAPNVTFDQTLWQIVTHRDVGQVRLESPELHLLFRQDGSNLEDLLGRRLKPQKPSGEAAAPRERRPPSDIKRSVDVRLVDSRVVWRTPASRQEWNVEGINLAFGLRPSWATASGSPELVVERGMVVDHCRISKGMCDDFLDLVAPILSKATDVEGAFSIDLDDWRVPLDRPETGQLGGRLSLHKVAVGGGSLVDQLAEKLHVPPVVELARESVVTFELLDGRIHHRDLEFFLPPLRVRTHGSVGFDDSLDMQAEIRVVLPDGITSALPSARELTEKTFLIPIIGTLSKPRIDVSAMGDSDLARVIDKLQQFVNLTRRKHRPAAGENEAQEPPDSHLPSQAVELLEELAGKWSQRRQKNKTDQPEDEPEKPAADDAPDSAGKKTMDRVLDRLRKLKK